MKGLLWREEGGERREEEGKGSEEESEERAEGERREGEVLQWLVPHPTGLRASVESSQRTWLQGGPVVTCPATPPRCQPASLEGEATEGLLLP